MCTGIIIRKNEYHDSVFLMRTAKRISDQEGILQAVLFMGTQKNKALLAGIGFPAGELAGASDNEKQAGERDGQVLNEGVEGVVNARIASLVAVKEVEHLARDAGLAAAAAHLPDLDRELDRCLQQVRARLAAASVPSTKATEI